MSPSIPFPLAQPTTDNILAICHYSNLRPRYTKDMLPGGFGYLHRQASAINQLESWFTVCCSNGTQDEEMTQCCAQQAWEKSLANFCNEEFGIKTRHYHCCKQNGQERWDCFKEEAPDPLYQPTVLGDEVPITLPSTIQDFDFNPSICKMTSVSEAISHTNPVNKAPTPQISLQGLPAFKPFSTRPSISFPLAFPNISNIFDICQYRSQRPQHSKETLPRRGFDYLHRQANAVNQLESCTSEKPVTMLPISFPPGRPNSGNFEPICVFRKYRPHYSTDCLPHTGYERFSYRLKTINGLEKSFRQCCKEKKDGQRCAEEKACIYISWKKMVDKFCNYEKKFKENQFECCKKQKGQEQYDCFSATATNPDYMVLNEPIQIGPFLSEFCVVYTDIQKMNLFPVDELTKKCCSPVLTEETTKCLQMQLDDILDAACKTEDPSLTKVRQNCCKKTGQKRSKCLTNMILQKISKAKNMHSHRRICPAYT
ncbi:extracellular matrix protein 1 isoform X1 [Silurus asotus]|uniref:Extracellular matrix protein 1 isoform X1 n=1 Tax=Silurus asotus TaxID=30991 RepID=A0AAD5ALS1_SILAS|nr:extracellular matrix protein 1 isoform X1 [Silurus asotus]